MKNYKEKKELIAIVKRQIAEVKKEKEMHSRRVRECTYNIARLKERLVEISKS